MLKNLATFQRTFLCRFLIKILFIWHKPHMYGFHKVLSIPFWTLEISIPLPASVKVNFNKLKTVKRVNFSFTVSRPVFGNFHYFHIFTPD